MDSNWATEHLQTIRTLMERATIYRRTLAPIMIFTGALGLVAGLTGYIAGWNTTFSFGVLWLITGVIAASGAFYIARRQAVKDAEPFWTPPARRVLQALLPAWLAGLCLSLPPIFANANNGSLIITMMWILFYGLGLHAAGFFMPRGIKWLGWIFVAGATVFACGLPMILKNFYVNTNILMGFFFGVLHLAHGGYLYWTEKRKNAA